MDVREALSLYSKTNVRYRAVIFTDNKIGVLQHLKNKLMQCLSPIRVWGSPEDVGAPPVPISRSDFCRLVLEGNQDDGLILFRPEQWMFDWTEKDASNFWIQLSETYGRNWVYVVTAEALNNLKFISNSFKKTNSDSQAFSVWISKHER